MATTPSGSPTKYQTPSRGGIIPRQMKGARTMTMAERIRIHKEIEEANRKHEQDWKEEQK